MTRVAVDAGDLVRDRRGIGRLLRAALLALAGDERIDLTLLADVRDESALRAEFPALSIAKKKTARERARYDVVWYPFNGMRFPCRAPSVVTMHDAFAFTSPHPERIARFREQAPIRRAARRATRIVTTCAWTRSRIARALHLDASAVAIVSPEPDRFFSPVDQARSGLAVSAPSDISGESEPVAIAKAFALIVGVREARKNVRLALDACAIAQRECDDVLAIVGTLGEPDRRHALSLGLRFHELVADDLRLRTLYRDASVVLVPSLDEGFGLVAVEAMACGAIVLAANTGALPEATRGAALLLDPHDAAAWASAMLELRLHPVIANERRSAALAAFASDDAGKYGREMTELLVDVSATNEYARES